MFQAQNREAIYSTWKVAVSFKIIMVERNKTDVSQKTSNLQDQDQDHFSV